MSINILSNVTSKLGNHTTFQLHKSQQTIFHGILKKIFDYSEYKLLKCIEIAKDEQQKLVLIVLLKDYINGHVAMAWKSGQPIWIKVTKA